MLGFQRPRGARQWSVRFEAQATVERMIGDGVPFEDIERYIEGLQLPSEQLGALWLLAWAEATDPVTRRQIVADTLAGLKDPERSQLAAAPGPAARTRPDHRRRTFLSHRRTGSRGRGWQRRRSR
jgi:hypothetical protein